MNYTTLLALLLMTWTSSAKSLSKQWAYEGCYSGNTIASQSTVSTDFDGVRSCRGICKAASHAYFGFHCPTLGTTPGVICRCADVLDGTMTSDADCLFSDVSSPCNGPTEVTDYIAHYSMGGQDASFYYSSFYSTSNLGAASPSACLDKPNFTDEQGYTCADWDGLDCRIASTNWGYSAQGQQDLYDNCCACTANCCPDRTDVHCVACLDNMSEEDACNADVFLKYCTRKGCYCSDYNDVSCAMCEGNYEVAMEACVDDPTLVDCNTKNAWKLIYELYTKVASLENQLHTPKVFGQTNSGEAVMTYVGSSICTLGNEMHYYSMCTISEGDSSNSQHAGKWILSNSMDGKTCEAICFEF